MANLASAKKAVHDWILQTIRVDAIDLDYPKQLYSPASNAKKPVPANTLTSYPVKDLVYEAEGVNTVTGRGTFVFSVCYRFPGLLTANQLPIAQIEAVVQHLFVTALVSGVCSSENGVKDIAPESLEFPVQVTRTDGDQSDWLVYAHLSFSVLFAVTDINLPDGFGGVSDLTTVDLTELNIKIYRGLINDLSDNTLDRELKINY